MTVSFLGSPGFTIRRIRLSFSFEIFLHQRLLMVFHWSLRDIKFPQVSRTLLSILAHFNNTVVWISFTRPLISKSYSPCTYPLVIVPSAPIVTFMFHGFFSSQARCWYLSLFSLYFTFSMWSTGTAKSTIRLVHLVRSSGQDYVIRFYVKIPANISRTDCG